MLEETKKRGFHLQEGWRRYIIYLNQPIKQRALLKFSRKQSFECAFVIKAQFDQTQLFFCRSQHSLLATMVEEDIWFIIFIIYLHFADNAFSTLPVCCSCSYDAISKADCFADFISSHCFGTHFASQIYQQTVFGVIAQLGKVSC